MLLGAGCLSLLLEFAINQRTDSEGSWIEGASILVAGGWLRLARPGAPAASTAAWQPPCHRRQLHARAQPCLPPKP